MGYKTTKETHDICQVCGNDWNTMNDEAVLSEIEKHLSEGAWNAGSSYTKIITVKTPIYNNITVIAASCNCGMSRIEK